MLQHSKETHMRATPHRAPTHKGDSARHFRSNTSKTHPRNVAFSPRRGGWRL